MNRSDFLKLMDNPSLADRQTMSELNGLIDIFPYFQGAYMLFLKSMYDNADVGFNEWLKKDAIFIADREILYYFLKDGRILKKNNDYNFGILDLDDEISPPDADEEMLSEEYDEVFKDNTDTELLELDDTTVGEEAPEKVTISHEQEYARDERNKQEQLSPEMLIDKFINEYKPVKPDRQSTKEEMLMKDLSAPYTEKKDGLVSETLAKIYIKQSYYSRAIDIYRKLSLNYPEKSSYFASQIEKVKDLIKNK